MRNKAVLSVNFSDQTATDNSGNGNHGVITGTPAFVESKDGSYAIYFHNAFGVSGATQYVTFSKLKGIDLTKEDFTIVFWYRTVTGGLNDWARATQASILGEGLHMSKAVTGGVIFSNQAIVKHSGGITAAQLPQKQFTVVSISDDNESYVAEGIREAADDSWHMVTVSCDRCADYMVNIDGKTVAAVDISALSGKILGENSLTLGADLLGQFGLENAYIDDVSIYTGIMDESVIRELYYVGRLNAMIHAVQVHVDELGREYEPYRMAIRKTTRNIRNKLATVVLDKDDSIVSMYNELREAYESFLSSPQKDARFSALLIGDLHIEKEEDECSRRFESILSNLRDNGLYLDLFLNPGDFANNSHPSSTAAAYSEYERLTKKYEMEQMLMLACFGNHEAQYTNEEENLKRSSAAYWEKNMAYLAPYMQRGEITLDDIHHDETGSSHCYGATCKGYHFLVLNTDYLKQVGNSRECLDENGEYSIEGNKLDPVRHGVYFYEQTFTWIKQVMNTYSKDNLPIFVLNHFPFKDTVSLSYFDEIVINDNSIGRQDARIRELLGRYKNVIYLCGHLHASFGMKMLTEVVSETGRTFTELCLSSPKTAARSYASFPAGWIMYVYEEEIVLRARDYMTNTWLTEYDAVVKLK